MTSRKLFLILVLFVSSTAQAQDSLLQQLPVQYLSGVASRVGSLEKKLDQKNAKSLREFQKSEEKIYRKLLRLDSAKASEFRAASQQQYQALSQKLRGARELTQYLPFLDTLKMSMQYLNEHRELLAKAGNVETQLAGAASKIKEYEQELAKADAVEQFLKQRRAQIGEQLAHLPLTRELKRINKQTYYVGAQVRQFKELLKDKRKREQKALALLSKTPAFKKFFARNSQFASMFRMPEAGGSNASLDGLQTRAMVQQLVSNRVGEQGPQFLQAQLTSTQQTISSQKQAVAIHLPHKKKSKTDFIPNSQKVKPFFKRLEYGSNLQFGKVNQLLPTTADLAFTLGYKLNDAGTIGLGSSYKLGLGTGISNIHFSHQGYTLRSFIAWRLKGNIFVTGGYEQLNLVKLPATTTYPVEQWQQSGLIGASKKYTISPKLKGNVLLLFDFLSYNSIPKRQPVVFRTGWNF